jgi:leucyl aminopeptidase
MKGDTVEVINTDAEGRLVLCRRAVVRAGDGSSPLA